MVSTHGYLPHPPNPQKESHVDAGMRGSRFDNIISFFFSLSLRFFFCMPVKSFLHPPLLLSNYLLADTKNVMSKKQHPFLLLLSGS